jgi:RNA polymerase sporulation-specific sigma factor
VAKWAERLDEIALRYHQGDESVRDELYQRGYQLVRVMVSLRDWYLQGGDRDDLIQEGMVGYWQAVEAWDPSRVTRFRIWAEYCIKRQLITALKMANRQKHRPLNYADRLEAPVEDWSGRPMHVWERLADGSHLATDPLERVIRLEERREAVELLDSLCDELSALERMALLETARGRTYEQVAARAGTTAKSVDNAVQRARRKLGIHSERRAV